MRRLLMIGIAGAALTGCATPNYPIAQGYVPPPPIRPTYAASQSAQVSPSRSATFQSAAPETVAGDTRDAAAQAESAPAGSAAAPTPAPVESSTLAPIATSPSVTTAPAAGAPAAPPPAAGSPAQAPNSQTAPATAATTASPPPPSPAYEPPVRSRESEVRYATDGKVVTPRGMYRDYEVQKGDHLDAIARDLDTTREELVRANRLKKPYQIVPGQHLKVPVAKAYVTVGGDTMAGVAKRFGVSVGELSALNDLSERAKLGSGMSIALPSRYTDHGPSRTVVSRETYVTPKPRATYRAEQPSVRPSYAAPTYQASGGPYVPSASALAAAAAHRAAESQPSPSAETASRAPVYSPPAASAPSPSAAAIAQLGQGKFIWPVRGQILSGFGDSGMGRRNDGIDIGAPAGSEVRAAAVGEVVYAGDQVPGFGNLVLVKHSGGWVSAYAHLATIGVRMRDTVYQGQVLGVVGETGGVSTPQLHFELRYAPTPADKAKPVDPSQVLPR